MKSFVVLCALVVLAQGASFNNRIVGGEDAKPGQFKYIASLRGKGSNFHFCGSTIIGKRYLATAAHCRVYDADQIEVVVGTTKIDDGNARRYNVESFTIHEDYDGSTITNDVAVVKLTEDIEFNDLVQPLGLASRGPADNERLTSSGWGYTSYPGSAPNNLQWMQMNVVNPDKCQSETGQIVTGKICTLESTGHGVCSGDSGGPLVRDNELVGITSAAYLCALGLPDFFTSVYYFRDWIEAHAEI